MKSTYTAQKKEEGVFRSWRWLWICTAGTGWLTQRKRKDAKKNILFRETTIPTPCRKYRQRRNIQKEGIDRHTLLRNRWRAWHLFELLSLLLSLRFFLALFIMAIEVFGIDVERKLQLGLRILTNFQLQNFVWDLLWIWVAASIQNPLRFSGQHMHGKYYFKPEFSSVSSPLYIFSFDIP